MDDSNETKDPSSPPRPTGEEGFPFVTITETALVEYCRITGKPLGIPTANELREELKLAKFVKTRGGAELWRGRRPWRLRFVVFANPDSMVLANVMPRSREYKLSPLARSMQVETDEGVKEFFALDVLFENGFERRVAFKTDEGWLVGRRGATMEKIIGGLMLHENPPEWVQKML